MFEGYSVTLPPPGEARGNPEPRELLDDDAGPEPTSEVRRASSPAPEPEARGETQPFPPQAPPAPQGDRQTLGFEPAEGDLRKVTPVAFEAMAHAAQSMKELDDRKKTPSFVFAPEDRAAPSPQRPTPLGIGVVTVIPSKPPDFYSAETEPVGPVPARPTAAPEGMRHVDVVVRLSGGLLKGRPAYVTLTLPSGEVLFEGDAVADGEGGARADVRAVVPKTVEQVKALVEAGGSYRTAMVRVAESGPTEYTFA
jgi:hypothetical protein